MSQRNFNDCPLGPKTPVDHAPNVLPSAKIEQNPMLGEGLVKYYVRWRHIPMELYMTPLYLISVDHTTVEAKKDASNYDIMKAVANEFPSMNISPDDVSIESCQPFA